MTDSVLCNDANGLTLVENGDVDPSVAGLFTSLVQAAAKLAPSQDAPTILIETDTRNIVVKEYDSLTVAIFQRETEAS